MSRMLLTPLDCISLIMGRTLGLVRGRQRHPDCCQRHTSRYEPVDAQETARGSALPSRA